MAKDKIIPPSLQPRKREKKPMPKLEAPKPKVKENKVSAKPKKVEKVIQNAEKKRFTLWLSPEVYRAFKVHTAVREGSSSDYLEELIRKDLKL